MLFRRKHKNITLIFDVQTFTMVPPLKLISYKWICSSEVGQVFYQRNSVAKIRMSVFQALSTTTVSPQNSSWFTLTFEPSNRLEKSTPVEGA